MYCYLKYWNVQFIIHELEKASSAYKTRITMNVLVEYISYITYYHKLSFNNILFVKKIFTFFREHLLGL